MSPELYQYLPNYCKLAIELADSCAIPRTAAAVNSAIDAYAKTYGEQCSADHRASTIYRCSKRFHDFKY